MALVHRFVTAATGDDSFDGTDPTNPFGSIGPWRSLGKAFDNCPQNVCCWVRDLNISYETTPIDANVDGNSAGNLWQRYIGIRDFAERDEANQISDRDYGRPYYQGALAAFIDGVDTDCYTELDAGDLANTILNINFPVLDSQ